jgi:hypothetical protein
LSLVKAYTSKGTPLMSIAIDDKAKVGFGLYLDDYLGIA